jgi:hypothetical protein
MRTSDKVYAGQDDYIINTGYQIVVTVISGLLFLTLKCKLTAQTILTMHIYKMLW